MTWPGLNSSLFGAGISVEPVWTTVVTLEAGFIKLNGWTLFKSTTYNDTLDIWYAAPIWKYDRIDLSKV